MPKDWFCYLLECADGSYYVGVAADMKGRLEEHEAGRGTRHTRLRRPVRLVWFQRYASYRQARALEARLICQSRGCGNA